MKKITAALFGLLIFFIPLVLATGSVQTVTLTPAAINLCGEYQQYATITAAGILNRENATLASASAKLYFAGTPGLNFITPQEVSLGDIAPLSQASTVSWTLQCSSPIQGTYIAYVNYSSQNGYKGSSLGEAVSTIGIYESAQFQGNISLIEGTLATQISQQAKSIVDNTPTLKVTTTKDSSCKGSIDQNKAYDELDFMFYGLQKDHNYTFISPISEGSHTVYVKCKDNADAIMPLMINFEVDTLPPAITLSSPKSKVIGQFTSVNISIDEDAECRISASDKNFSSMDHFDISAEKFFSTEIINLEEGDHSYYVRCRDNIGNIASMEVLFNVAIPPVVEIVLEKESPLTKGTYELKLYTSKKLRNVPELTYSFTDDTNFVREVSLVKESNFYKGYIIIEDSIITRSGIFSFRGYDLEGTLGTEISKGSTFLVDTIKPGAPDTLQGKYSDQKINLDWYYDGEKPDHFNIYRSTAQGVSYINLHASTKMSQYSDSSAASQLYYYRVAAVDIAGNIGPLSNEVSVYAKSSESELAPQIASNPPTQATREWKTLTEKNIDGLLIDLDWAQNNLKEQGTKDSSVELLSLVKQVMSATEDISKLKTQIKGIDVLTVSDTDLRDTLSKADALMARIKKTVPQSLVVEKAANYVQSTIRQDIESAVTELLSKKNYTEQQAKKYIDEMEKLNRLVKVESTIKTLKIEFLDDSAQNKIIVTKRFSYESPDPVSNVVALEVIPKTVAGDASALDLRTPDYDVINPDPVISWNYNSLGFDKQEIIYVLLSNDDSESAKSSKTIVLIDPTSSISDDTNIISGFSIMIDNISGGGIQTIGVIFGFIIILGLGMYYFVVINEMDLSMYLKNKVISKIIPRFAGLKPQTKVQDSAKKADLAYVGVQDIPVTAEVNDVQAPAIIQVFRSDDPLRIQPQKYFYAKNGDIIRGVSELKNALKHMDDFTFFYHVHDGRNDFAAWVAELYKSEDLVALIKAKKSRGELISLLEKITN